MAQVLAVQMGFREEAVRRAELGGMLLEMGRKGLLVYRKTLGDEEGSLDKDFMDAYHPYLGERLAAYYGLPAYVRFMIRTRALVLDERDLTLSPCPHGPRGGPGQFLPVRRASVLMCTTPRPATDTSRTLEASSPTSSGPSAWKPPPHHPDPRPPPITDRQDRKNRGYTGRRPGVT
jgi:hypothetical protein